MVRTSLCFVDDEPGILKALERMVHPLRIPAVFFPRAAPALDYLAVEDPCVIVSDFKMPGMKGVEFLERSRELRPFASRILLTGFA
jgi:DNA-binding NtrC family response regulator